MYLLKLMQSTLSIKHLLLLLPVVGLIIQRRTLIEIGRLKAENESLVHHVATLERDMIDNAALHEQLANSTDADVTLDLKEWVVTH